MSSRKTIKELEEELELAKEKLSSAQSDLTTTRNELEELTAKLAEATAAGMAAEKSKERAEELLVLAMHTARDLAQKIK